MFEEWIDTVWVDRAYGTNEVTVVAVEYLYNQPTVKLSNGMQLGVAYFQEMYEKASVVEEPEECTCFECAIGRTGGTGIPGITAVYEQGGPWISKDSEYPNGKPSLTEAIDRIMSGRKPIYADKDSATPDTDAVSPSHYSECGIQPVEYILANKLDFCEGNVIKYITRHKSKNGAEDLRKAIKNIESLLEEYEKSV